MNKDLKILPLTKEKLRHAIDHNLYWKDDLIPLPKSKAQWILSNERIEEDDYCGVLGLEGDKLVSFVYMLPDFLALDKNETKKIYWILLWWVNDEYKNTVLGTYIYNEAVNLTGKQVLIKSYAEGVNDFYEKQPFEVISSRLRYTIFFSLDSSILIGRFSFLKRLRFFIDIADTIVSKVVRTINAYKLKHTLKQLSYDYITQLDHETWEFIQPLCEKDLIHKTKSYVNWQISNIQYSQIRVPDRYPFKSLQVGNGHNIGIRNIKILKNKELIGFLSYTKNHKEFNVKYFLVNNAKNYDICVAVLIDHFIHEKTNFIFTDDTELAGAIKKKYTTIFIYKIIKKALAHKEIQLDFNQMTIYNRDGHFY